MKLINPSFEIIEQSSGIEGIYKMIEIAGRTAYKSEDKITEGSAKKFVDRMISVNHGSPLEHGTVYLKIPSFKPVDRIINVFNNNPYTKCNSVVETSNIKDGEVSYITHYISTNFRVLFENNLLDVLKYLCKPTEYHEKRVCVKFICDRGVSHEFVRHRVFSFLQESTRYNNYSKDKFNNEVTFILPPWVTTKCPNDNQEGPTTSDIEWSNSLLASEKSYFKLLEQGWKPQEAREVLPNATKTELIMTGFVSDWKHFFLLRCDNAAHPQARELAIPLYQEFLTKKYL